MEHTCNPSHAQARKEWESEPNGIHHSRMVSIAADQQPALNEVGNMKRLQLTLAILKPDLCMRNKAKEVSPLLWWIFVDLGSSVRLC